MSASPSRPTRGALLAAGVAALLLGPDCVGAAGTDRTPGAGYYRIDADTTTTISAGGVSAQQVQHVDGATGDVTSTSRDASGAASRPLRVAGGGPNTWCVPSSGAAPPARIAGATCARSGSAAGGTHLECAGASVDERWSSLGEGQWERTLRSSQHPVLSVPGATAPSLPGMPSAADHAAAMAPVIAGLEEQAATGSPEDAALARQQLSLLRGEAPGAASNATVVETTERWTRIAGACPAGTAR